MNSMKKMLGTPFAVNDINSTKACSKFDEIICNSTKISFDLNRLVDSMEYFKLPVSISIFETI